jgi:hypothetical protein
MLMRKQLPLLCLAVALILLMTPTVRANDYEGQILSVDVLDRLLDIVEDTGDVLEFLVDPDAVITLNGQNIFLRALQPGWLVRVHTNPNNPSVAVRVDAFD